MHFIFKHAFKKQDVYIVGILGHSHSGSTILARWLSLLSNSIALGETRGVFRGKPLTKNPSVRLCSCYKELDDCEVWGARPKNLEDLKKLLPEKTIFITSSKAFVEGDINIFLYKNILSLYKSAKKRSHTTFGLIALLYALIRQITLSFFRIIRARKPTILISYKEFQTNPEHIHDFLSELLGVSAGSQECSHIAFSSKAKYEYPMVIHR